MEQTFDTPIWASEAAPGAVAAPSDTKQKQGWGAENPPYEFMNWWMNKVDTQLKTALTPWAIQPAYSAPFSRPGAILAGSLYTTPKYIVGAGTLRVYKNEMPCFLGIHYDEIGTTGDFSTSIKWRVNIAPADSVLITAPYDVYGKIHIINDSGLPPKISLAKRRL